MDTPVPDLKSHTVAWFRSRDAIRAAELALERSGIEAEFIEVARPDPRTERRKIDRRTFNALGRRMLVGLALGITVGAFVGFLIGLLLGSEGFELWAFAFGGAVFGAAPGFFYTVGTKLPAQEQAFDTYGDSDRVEPWIAVSGPDDVQNEAARILADQRPVRMDGVAAA
jgi:hypothetical protein